MIIRSSDFNLPDAKGYNDTNLQRIPINSTSNATLSTSETPHSLRILDPLAGTSESIPLLANLTDENSTTMLGIEEIYEYNSFYGLKTFLILFTFLVIGVLYALYKSKCQTPHEIYMESMIRKSQEENNLLNEWKRALVRRRFRERMKEGCGEYEMNLVVKNGPSTAANSSREKVEAWLARQTPLGMDEGKVYSFFMTNAKYLCNHQNSQAHGSEDKAILAMHEATC